MKRLQRKKPWYKNTAGLCSIAAVAIALGVVLFFVLRGSGEKEPEVPDMPPVEEPTPEPEPALNPPEEPEQTIFSQGEVTDGVWNLILVNPWNPMPENYSVELEEISGGGVDKRCYPQLQKMMANIHKISADAAEEYGMGYDLVSGANIAGFQKVAEAMMEQGCF